MLDACGVTMTRSALNRPADRISSSSPLISCCTLANTGPDLSLVAVTYAHYPAPGAPRGPDRRARPASLPGPGRSPPGGCVRKVLPPQQLAPARAGLGRGPGGVGGGG